MFSDRRNHGCTHYRQNGVDFVLVAGGHSDGDLQTTEVLNLRTRQWQMAGDMSLPRSGLRLAVVEGGKVLATGVDHMKNVEEFDTQELRWRTLDSHLMLTRNNHAVTPIPASLLSCEIFT